MRWDPQLRGDVEPTGPSGVGNPQIELTARTYSWQSGYEPDNTTTGLLFGNGHGSAHTIRSVPKNVELHALTIGGPVEVPLAPVSSARDSYQNGRDGDAGNYLANVTVSTGTPANVSLRDSAGDTLSFGALSDGETVTRSMDLALGDVLRVSYAANGADVLGTIRYREASLSRNVSITVNGNRTAHTGTLAPGETVSLPANDSWLRSGTNTITIGLDRAGMDAPARAVDVRYRHELDRSAAVDADAGTRADASDSAGTSDAASTPGAVADTVVTDVSFERGTIRSSETAVVVVTVRNPQSTADTHLVELELFDQVVNSREVTVAANDEATVRFVHTIVASGTYTARVGNETATIRVLASDETPSSTPVADSPSTALPSVRLLVVVALVSFVVAALLARRD
jgi:hypothetical protein